MRNMLLVFAEFEREMIGQRTREKLYNQAQKGYWGVGFAEGLGLPVIYICEKSVFDDKNKQPHFDTNHHLTVIWENTTEGLQKFAEELKAVIRNTFPAEAKMSD